MVVAERRDDERAEHDEAGGQDHARAAQGDAGPLAQRASASMSRSFLPRDTRTLSPMAMSTAGSRVRVARATAITEMIMPRGYHLATSKTPTGGTKASFS